MLTDNLQYLTDEERGWREESTRLLIALDRLAASRARLAKLGNSDELEEMIAFITALEQELAYYKTKAA